MTVPEVGDRAWQSDDAAQALQQWILSWRDTHRQANKPSLTFARHLGGCVVGMSGEGVPRIELLRIASAAGLDGTCVCGQAPDGATP